MQKLNLPHQSMRMEMDMAATDPLWYYNYSWWYFGQNNNPYTKLPDPQVAKVAYLNAGLLVRDRLGDKLKGMKVRLLDWMGEGDLHSYLEGLGATVEAIKQQEIAQFLSFKTPLDTILVLNGFFYPQSKELVQTIQGFANEGGKVFIFNSASHIVASIFPGRIVPAIPSTTIAAKLKALTDKKLFKAYGHEAELALEYSRFPVENVDKSNTTTQVIARIETARVEPLLLKFTFGQGTIYLFVSKMFKAESSITDVSGWLTKQGASSITIASWKCAEKLQFKGFAPLAIRAFPSMELVAKLFLKEMEPAATTSTTTQPSSQSQPATSTAQLPIPSSKSEDSTVSMEVQQQQQQPMSTSAFLAQQ